MMNQINDSIVLTGCGWVTPFFSGSISAVLGAARTSTERKPATVRRISIQPPQKSRLHPAGSSDSGSAIWVVPEDMLGDYPDLCKEIRGDKGAWMTGVALIHACREASLRFEALDADRIGLVLGCGLAGQSGMIDFANDVRRQSPRFVSPIHFPQTVGNYIAGAVARGFDIRGPNMTLASGSASGLNALVEGCAILSGGRADLVIAGGTEQLSNALAEGLAGPGGVLSEGACLFVLERSADATARGSKALATVKSWDNVDASSMPHIAHPKTRSEPGGRLSSGRGGTEHSDDRLSARAEARGSGILSVAGFRHPGAVFIEHWVGRCIGASGAAAAAAAIGAAEGCTVPLLDGSDPGSIREGIIDVPGMRGSDGHIRAVILADADGGTGTLLELAVQTG